MKWFTHFFKSYKREIFTAFIIVTVLLPAILYRAGHKINQTDNTITTQLQNRVVSKTYRVDGEVKSDSQVEIHPELSGRLVTLTVSAGDTVIPGQLLATIENSAQKASLTKASGAVSSAKANVEVARANLDKLLNGASEADINVYKSKENSAKVALNNAYSTAKDALQSAYSGTVSEISLGTDTLFNNADTVNPTIKFDTTDYSDKINVENTRVALSDILKRHNNITAYQLTDADILPEINKTKIELIILRKFTDTLLKVLNGAVADNKASSEQISAYTTVVSNARNQIIQNINSLTRAASTINSAKGALTTAKEGLNKILTDPRKEDVEVAKSNLKSAEAGYTQALGAYNAAQSALNKTYIKSPTAGVVADTYKDVGEFVSPTQNILTINSNLKYISVLIPEVDLSKVRVNMNVRAKFDAFKNKIFTGKLVFIYPQKIEKAGIVYYEGKVILDDQPGVIILPGMSLDVYLIYKNTSPVPSLPINALIQDESGRYYVQVLKDGDIIKKYVKVGVIGDNYAEIIEGIQPTDSIMLKQ